MLDSDTSDLSALEVGAFYWVLIVLDVDYADGDEWVNQMQPARYAGDGHWNYLAVDGKSDWPVRLIGQKIVAPA